MKPYGLRLFTLVLGMGLLASMAGQASASQGNGIFHYGAYGFDIEILTHEDWRAKYARHSDIPRTDEEVIALAEKLFPLPIARTAAALEPGDPNDDIGVRLLVAALRNPEISDDARTYVNHLMTLAVPAYLTETYTEGHFRISYTDDRVNHPNDAVSRRRVRKVAEILNRSWDVYSANFADPLVSNPEGLIEVWIYDLPGDVYGQTWPNADLIELDATTCVLDRCIVVHTCAHELFHRVQFAYGFEVGDYWFLEGTAAWSEKFVFSWRVARYLNRMNQGLAAPDTSLFSRSYDAAHFWVYVEEQTSWEVIEAIMEVHAADPTQLKNNLEFFLSFHGYANLSAFLRQWNAANYLKDLRRPGSKYDYDEDEKKNSTCNFGPLQEVPRESAHALFSNAFDPVEINSHVEPHGVDYHEVVFMDNGFTNFKVEIDGSDAGDFSYYLIPVARNSWLDLYEGQSDPYILKRDASNWDKLAIIVIGENLGGNYTIKIGPDSPAGLWADPEGGTFLLTENGDVFVEHVNCTPNSSGYWGYDAQTDQLDIFVNFTDFSCCTFNVIGAFTSSTIEGHLVTYGQMPWSSQYCSGNCDGGWENCPLFTLTRID